MMNGTHDCAGPKHNTHNSLPNLYKSNSSQRVKHPDDVQPREHQTGLPSIKDQSRPILVSQQAATNRNRIFCNTRTCPVPTDYHEKLSTRREDHTSLTTLAEPPSASPSSPIHYPCPLIRQEYPKTGVEFTAKDTHHHPPSRSASI